MRDEDHRVLVERVRGELILRPLRAGFRLLKMKRERRFGVGEALRHVERAFGREMLLAAELAVPMPVLLPSSGCVVRNVHARWCARPAAHRNRMPATSPLSTLSPDHRASLIRYVDIALSEFDCVAASADPHRFDFAAIVRAQHALRTGRAAVAEGRTPSAQSCGFFAHILHPIATSLHDSGSDEAPCVLHLAVACRAASRVQVELTHEERALLRDAIPPFPTRLGDPASDDAIRARDALLRGQESESGELLALANLARHVAEQSTGYAPLHSLADRLDEACNEEPGEG